MDYRMLISADGAGVAFVDLTEGSTMASLAVITTNPDGGFTVTPASSADIAAVYDAEIAPRVNSQVASLMGNAITAAEQRMWQRMVDADTNKATEIMNSVDAKDSALVVGLIQNMIAALQAKLDELTP